MVWVLWICTGITGWGCGSSVMRDMPSKEVCMEAAKAVRVEDNGKMAVGETGRQTVIACIPKV